jgi:hypothetical protein
MQACLEESAFTSGPEVFDRQYFYRTAHDRWHCTNGIARITAADLLLVNGPPNDYLEPSWLDALENFINRPASFALIIKHICLASLSINGLVVDGVQLAGGPMISLNRISFLEFTNSEPRFFVPETSIRPGVDGIFVKADETQNTAHEVLIYVAVIDQRNPLERRFARVTTYD